MNDELKGPKALINLMTESEAYTSLDLIESYMEQGASLESLPVQPLYLALNNLPAARIAACLSSFSKEQRQAFLDLDLWHKDDVDVSTFSKWIDVYANCGEDEMRYEFSKSSEFLLFLKGRVNIWTFDVEDPKYPDHDYYFLTEDNLLLVEYDEHFEFPNEIKLLIRDLYSELGVEKAYAFLFKMISDNFSTYQEDEFRRKNERLREFGFVDYFDALEINNCFPTLGHLHYFIKSKGKITGNIDGTGKKQALHKNSIVAFRKTIDKLEQELALVESDKRVHYLNFNFMRLVNGMLSLNNSLKQGPVAMTRVGEQVRAAVELGHLYLIKHCNENSYFSNEATFFERFDFSDLYKIGNSLLFFTKNNIKKALRKFELEGENEAFLGQYWCNFLELSFASTAKLNNNGDNEEIITPELLEKWTNHSSILVQLLPFVSEFKKSYHLLLEQDRLRDEYYLNYNVIDIDFQAILLSSFANFTLSGSQTKTQAKLGVTIDEYLEFSKIILKNQKLVTDEKLTPLINNFCEHYGMQGVLSIEEYLIAILKEEMEDLDYDQLGADEFKHVGGPIILHVI